MPPPMHTGYNQVGRPRRRLPPKAHVSTPKTVDPDRLSGEHNWEVEPVADMSYRTNVDGAPSPRADMKRYREIASNDFQRAKDLWSKMANSQKWFKIPDSVKCDRTFARDPYEVYYLDAMQAFLQREDRFKAEELPFFSDSLQNRPWNAFEKRPGYFFELFSRVKVGLWLPHDCPETSDFSYEELANDHPQVFTWLEKVFQPTGLPVPMPPAVWYFHDELAKNASETTSENSVRFMNLRYCARIEYLCLFISTWWCEAFFGCRQFILHDYTIDYLEEQCCTLPIVPGKTTQSIVNMMRSAAKKDESYYNYMIMSDNSLPSAPFLWCYKECGEFDPGQPANKTLYINMRTRKMRSGEETYRDYNRGGFALRSALREEDYNEVPGLAALVRARGWDVNGEPSALDVIKNLYILSSTALHSFMRAADKFQEARYDRDNLNRFIDGAVKCDLDMDYSRARHFGSSSRAPRRAGVGYDSRQYQDLDGENERAVEQWNGGYSTSGHGRSWYERAHRARDGRAEYEHGYEQRGGYRRYEQGGSGGTYQYRKKPPSAGNCVDDHRGYDAVETGHQQGCGAWNQNAAADNTRQGAVPIHSGTQVVAGPQYHDGINRARESNIAGEVGQDQAGTRAGGEAVNAIREEGDHGSGNGEQNRAHGTAQDEDNGTPSRPGTPAAEVDIRPRNARSRPGTPLVSFEQNVDTFERSSPFQPSESRYVSYKRAAGADGHGAPDPKRSRTEMLTTGSRPRGPFTGRQEGVDSAGGDGTVFENRHPTSYL